MGNKQKVIIFFLIILLLGTFLRLHQLEEESLWVDEGFTLHYTTQSMPELLSLLKYDVHPILFYVIEMVQVKTFGISEFSLRFPAFLFGMLCIPIFFLFARELYNRKIALLATTFFSFSFTFILYSQEAKMYSQFMFFSLLAFLFFTKFIKSGKLSDALWLALFNALMVHTHILSFGVLFLEFVLFFVLAKSKEIDNNPLPFKTTFKKKYFLLSIGFTLATYLFWLPIFVSQFDRLFLDMLPVKFIQKFGFDGFHIFFILFLISAFTKSYITYLIAGSTKWTKRFDRTIPRIANNTFIFIFLLFLILVFFFHKPFFGNIPYVRYLLVFIPFVYIFFAKRLFSLPKKLFVLLIFLYFIITSVVLINYYTLDGKEQFREAAEFADSGTILLDTSDHAWWAFTYYSNKDVVRLEKDDITLIPQLKGTVFLVQSHNFYSKDFFKNALLQTGTLIDENKLIGVKVSEFII